MRARLALLVMALAGCGGTGAFSLSSADNDRAALEKAMAVEKRPTPGRPQNATGQAMVFLVTADKKLVAWDLAAGKAAWSVDADVQSRVVVGGRLVAAQEGRSLVGRDVKDGHRLFSRDVEGRLLGLSADGDRVFYASELGEGSKKTWVLHALGPAGDGLWRTESPGAVGAPAARGGLLYVPFMSQWLEILDGTTGKLLTRIRQTDQAVSYVRATPEGVFYGSRGVLILDTASVAGTRKDAHYAEVKLPAFAPELYHFDAFSPVQAAYSAYDRKRILWRASGDQSGLHFAEGEVVLFHYRFFFALEAGSGKLKWAYQHPRVDVVSAEHSGQAILYVSSEGELGALDPASGALVAQAKVGARVVGATFDADGYRPAGTGTPAPTDVVLATIVADRDARFGAVKLFATESLGTRSGAEVSAALLKILTDEGTPRDVYQKTAEVLVSRKDPAGLPVFSAELAKKYDYIAGTGPRAVDVIARALGALGDVSAVPALVRQLDQPETPIEAVQEIAAALAAVHAKQGVPALRSFLLSYRCDPLSSPATTGPALAPIVDALLALGGGAERELVAFVAGEPRTDPLLAKYAEEALARSAAKPPGNP